MSYCRWSSDDFACDLYCYQSGDGWITHVGTTRFVVDIPKLPSPVADLAAFLAACQRQSAALKDADSQPIGLPFDGQSFRDDCLEDFRERLLALRAAGYRFPDYVMETVDREMAEGAHGE